MLGIAWDTNVNPSRFAYELTCICKLHCLYDCPQTVYVQIVAGSRFKRTAISREVKMACHGHTKSYLVYNTQSGLMRKIITIKERSKLLGTPLVSLEDEDDGAYTRREKIQRKGTQGTADGKPASMHAVGIDMGVWPAHFDQQQQLGATKRERFSHVEHSQRKRR